MNLTLVRYRWGADGVFGRLLNEAGDPVLYALEHAYPRITSDSGDTVWEPKIPAGKYVCVRGLHRLHGMTEDFETFEVMNVPGHQGILFHWGNWNRDSDGCVILGDGMAVMNNVAMLTRSRESFWNFMNLQSNLNNFDFTVE